MITRAYKYFYIDSKSGSDSNPGTKFSPFKTLDRAFDEYNNYSELRFHFIGDGAEYSTSVLNFTGIGMHIKNQSNNNLVKINLPKDCSFYECHININNVQDNKRVQLNINDKLYNDGGSVLAVKTDLVNGEYVNYGGSAVFQECGFSSSGSMCRVENGGTTILAGCEFNGLGSDSTAITAHRANLIAHGYIKSKGRLKRVLSANMSVLSLCCVLTNTATLKDSNTALNGITNVTKSRKESWGI